MLGLTKYTDSSAADDVMSLVKCLKEVDLLICSSFTSMVIDAAICGVPSLWYFPFNSRFFERRKYKFQLNEACRAIDQPSVPLAKDLTELCNLASTILSDSRLRSEITSQIVNDWHYPSASFEVTLTHSVFNELLVLPSDNKLPTISDCSSSSHRLFLKFIRTCFPVHKLKFIYSSKPAKKLSSQNV